VKDEMERVLADPWENGYRKDSPEGRCVVAVGQGRSVIVDQPEHFGRLRFGRNLASNVNVPISNEGRRRKTPDLWRI